MPTVCDASKNNSKQVKVIPVTPSALPSSKKQQKKRRHAFQIHYHSFEWIGDNYRSQPGFSVALDMTEMAQSYTTIYDIQHTFGRATQYEYVISESVPVVISTEAIGRVERFIQNRFLGSAVLRSE